MGDLRARRWLPIPNSMRFRPSTTRRIDLSLSVRDLSLAGMLVSPIWLALGVAAGDLLMIVAGVAVALVSIVNVTPRLAWLRDASVARLPRWPLGERFLERSSCSELERKRRHHHVPAPSVSARGPGERSRRVSVPASPLSVRIDRLRRRPRCGR